MNFIKVGCALSVMISLLSAPALAEQSAVEAIAAQWEMRGSEAWLGTTGWVISAEHLEVLSGHLEATDFVVVGREGVQVRGEQLRCTTTECAMVAPVVYRGGAAVRAKHGALELTTGRVVLKELGNWTLEER